VLVRHLSWILALGDHEQVTEAAAALGVSQPTLSRALARVEAEIGIRLFERDATGVHPNPYGELVLVAARDLTGRYQQLLAEIANRLDPDTGTVRLAFLDSMATSLVPRILGAFHRRAPRVQVSLRQEPSHEIVRDLASGVSELAIISPRPSGDLGWLPLQHERLTLVVPATHRLIGRRRVRLEELADEGFVTTPVGFGFRALVDELFAHAGVTPRVSFESGDLATIEGLVAAGLGIALLPEQFAGLSNTVGIPLAAPEAERAVGLTWRLDRELAPAAARFLDFVRDSRPFE
jgi:LysR family transcriptional regulator, transcription activator of glutamate synthase operon